MLKILILSFAAGALALPALADCAGEEAALRAKAADVASLSEKIEAHRVLVQTASAGYENAADETGKTTFDEQLSTYESEMDGLKAARGSALYDIVDLSATYKKACKTPAEPLLGELGIKVADLPVY